MRAVAGLLPGAVEALSGEVWFAGSDLLEASPEERRSLMATEIGMIFQEPMTALNPTMRVGKQIAESPKKNLGKSSREAHSMAIEMMRATGIADPERRASAFPHELSGGLRQRVMIAMALVCRPQLVLCDEPTTALDVTVQDQVLKLLSHLCDSIGTALIFVTHDLAVIMQMCSRVSVMYAGGVIEQANVADIYNRPLHPYTEALFKSAPDLDEPERTLTPIPGFPPQLKGTPNECTFTTRCSYVRDSCYNGAKVLTSVGKNDRYTACDRWAEIFVDCP
jgi:oligopeptide/dipeptide ABC transporter ATP-binding protein